MAHTAINQNRIKAASGDARTGRKLAYPVYTYSLPWAPDQQPRQEQMIEAGLQTLKELGLEGHEVLMVAHRDEPHPHIHLIVNRVHPQAGKAASLSNDHLNLSRWAEAYEREQGKIRCEQRVLNNEARRKGRFVKDLRRSALLRACRAPCLLASTNTRHRAKRQVLPCAATVTGAPKGAAGGPAHPAEQGDRFPPSPPVPTTAGIIFRAFAQASCLPRIVGLTCSGSLPRVRPVPSAQSPRRRRPSDNGLHRSTRRNSGPASGLRARGGTPCPALARGRA